MKSLLSQWEEMCVERLKLLLNSGFYFSKNKDLDGKLRGGASLNGGDRMSCVEYFYNVIDRIPRRNARVVEECQGIVVPSELQTGYEMLKSELKKGDDLLPRMSRQSKDLDYHDGMLDDWGVCHFHLGVRGDLKHNGLIEGTGKIAYVYFAPYEDVAYVVDVADHGKWGDVDVLERLLASFPEALAAWEMKGFTAISFNAQGLDRVSLRKAFVNSATEVKGRVYCSPWGGVMSNGVRMRAAMEILHSRRFLDQIDGLLPEKLKGLGIPEEQVDNLILKGFSYGRNWYVLLENPQDGSLIHLTERCVGLVKSSKA